MVLGALGTALLRMKGNLKHLAECASTSLMQKIEFCKDTEKSVADIMKKRQDATRS